MSRIRTGTAYVLNVLPLPKLGYHGIQTGAQGETRTHTVLCLRQAPPANWATWAGEIKMFPVVPSLFRQQFEGFDQQTRTASTHAWREEIYCGS